MRIGMSLYPLILAYRSNKLRPPFCKQKITLLFFQTFSILFHVLGMPNYQHNLYFTTNVCDTGIFDVQQNYKPIILFQWQLISDCDPEILFFHIVLWKGMIITIFFLINLTSYFSKGTRNYLCEIIKSS